MTHLKIDNTLRSYLLVSVPADADKRRHVVDLLFVHVTYSKRAAKQLVDDAIDDHSAVSFTTKRPICDLLRQAGCEVAGGE